MLAFFVVAISLYVLCLGHPAVGEDPCKIPRFFRIVFAVWFAFRLYSANGCVADGQRGSFAKALGFCFLL